MKRLRKLSAASLLGKSIHKIITRSAVVVVTIAGSALVLLFGTNISKELCILFVTRWPGLDSGFDSRCPSRCLVASVGDRGRPRCGRYRGVSSMCGWFFNRAYPCRHVQITSVK